MKPIGEQWQYLNHINCPNYAVSSKGRVRDSKGNLLPTRQNRNGFYEVSIRDNMGTGKRVYVHRLVAQLFIPNPHNYHIVTHIDGNYSNNDVSNIRWIDRSSTPYRQDKDRGQSHGTATTPIGEIWKPTKYDRILISNKGRVQTKRGNITFGVNSYGYKRIYVAKNKYVLVHRLVAETFLGNPPEGKNFVVHKNGDAADNNASNLEWQSLSFINKKIRNEGKK